jgi:flagellar motor switch protein FliM
MQRFLPPTEKILCMSFEVKLADTNGMLNLIFPVSISNTLLRKLSADSSYGTSRRSDEHREQITTRMLQSSFPIELGITAITLPIETLAALVPNTICNLGVPVRKSASLLIAGREVFEATPARQGLLRAAHLGRNTVLSSEERKA